MAKLVLEQERKRRGWSQVKVCQLTGIDPATLSRLERGVWPAYPGWRSRLAGAFNMTAEELFRKVEEPDPGLAAATGA